MSSSTRLLVLGVVRIFQPVHGYDVRRELLSWRADEWGSVSPGSIYNALKSLTKDALLEMVGVDQVGGRPERTTYRLTTEGEGEFQQLLREAWWTVRSASDLLLPALAFLWAMPRTELIAALHHRIAQLEGAQQQMKFAIDAPLPEGKPEHVKEMFRLSRTRMAAEVGWARELIGRLEAGVYDCAEEHAADRAAIASPAAPPTATRPTATRAAAKTGKTRRR